MAKDKFVKRKSEVRFYNDYNWARIEFLRAIARVAPGVVRDLRNRLLPKHNHLVPQTLEGRLGVLVDYEEIDQLLIPLSPAIEEWAKNYRLDGPDGPLAGPMAVSPLPKWMGRIIVKCLFEWVTQGSPEPSDWPFRDEDVTVSWLHPPACQFACEGWDPRLESEKTFRERARASFEDAVEEYIQRQRAGYLDRTGEQISFYVQTPRRCTVAHFDWLVMYQVQSLSTQDIADQVTESRTGGPPTSRQTVQAGIKDAAEHIHGSHSVKWLRSPSPGGRPPMSSRNE
ncbi:MAG: hypothetical protein K8U57_35525 [Planctomycetes bacterium]|nr:hypothetical protein [Planctomycetota bacterium]